MRDGAVANEDAEAYARRLALAFEAFPDDLRDTLRREAGVFSLRRQRGKAAVWAADFESSS
jgi:hypothetical protein